MAILKKIIHILSYACYLLIILYAIVCIPCIFKYKPLIVLSGSMEPTYDVGSIIYYKHVDESKLKIDDVITFESFDGELVTHRIYSMEDNYYITKGDANEIPDPGRVSYENIKGKVHKKSIPYIGYYVKFINEHKFTIVIVVILLILEYLFSGYKVKKEEGVLDEKK